MLDVDSLHCESIISSDEAENGARVLQNQWDSEGITFISH